MLNIKPRVRGGTLLMDVRITAVVHAGTCKYGNPYYVVLTENDGEFRTVIGAAVNYNVPNYQWKLNHGMDPGLVCLELSRSGRIRYITPMADLNKSYRTEES